MKMELSGCLSCRCQSEVSSQYFWEWCSFPQNTNNYLALIARPTFAPIVEGSLLSRVTWIATSVPTLGRSLSVATIVHIALAENIPLRIILFLTIMIWDKGYNHYRVVVCRGLITIYDSYHFSNVHKKDFSLVVSFWWPENNVTYEGNIALHVSMYTILYEHI